jgi:hypothetical protein
MFRYLAALILVAALAASTNKSVDARVVHPVVGPVVGPDLEAAGPSPADDDDGRRLIGTTGHDELVALCQQVAHEFDL